jgi:isoamylase/glycogen operon protein
MRRFAATDNATLEFKTLIRELHKNGIEAILDVVYNHTGEAGDKKYCFSFRGIDNSVYYIVDEQGNYRDFTGCKNTVNANHWAVQEHILSSLRFWAGEMQVDGFRFDLASILTRGPDGGVMKSPPLLQKIAVDPLLKHIKLISESWDASGLYQLGQFPDFGSWSEWNGEFRDRVRNFIKGTNGCAGRFAKVITGSQYLYRSHGPLSSVNFITAHDGYSLHDLVSYNEKHNEANGQRNRDGSDQNFSWNCGVEGPTDDSVISQLRQRQMRNFLLALFLSQGIPMLLMGDEYGHTRRGNNNPFVQDNEINWFLWDELEKNKEQFEFIAELIAFRKEHPALRRTRFLTDADVDWHGIQPFQPDWSTESRFVAFTLKGPQLIYVAFNADFRRKQVALPPGSWREIVRTDRPWKENHLKEVEKGPQIVSSIELISYSAILAIGKS